MKIIVGLGNPGINYERTRHNLGFLAIDQMRKCWDARVSCVRHEGEVSFVQILGQEVMLVKPQTYMNQSGRCVASLYRFYRCVPEDLIVIHDDLDLPFLTLRLKTGGGTGGHRGLQSLEASLGKEHTKYHRIRIGIDRPSALSRIEVADYVLQRFSDAQYLQVSAVLEEVNEAALLILEGKMQEAMNCYHKKKR